MGALARRFSAGVGPERMRSIEETKWESIMERTEQIVEADGVPKPKREVRAIGPCQPSLVWVFSRSCSYIGLIRPYSYSNKENLNIVKLKK